MISWLKRLFTRRAKPRIGFHVYDMRDKHLWGDTIEWFDVEDRRIVGWCEPIPARGDVVKSPMRSGRVGMFVITKVEPCRDPPDMFFATVEPIGYDEGPAR